MFTVQHLRRISAAAQRCSGGAARVEVCRLPVRDDQCEFCEGPLAKITLFYLSSDEHQHHYDDVDERITCADTSCLAFMNDNV
ncbi:MAG: hypothetical protein COX39_02430 [Candidatus Nealsonbacteria bacterium CG23_combo_of_CG06-09_8_20_14_all_40_13]|uniref:Uncharacterized protein n=2 Tax=Bacteria candidate phyla TaxID=1783234 RepID=A0A2G9YS68_9BACT|nr:MAG: hypothetical protein AUJ40_03030 [Candidatus Berkelbacteria bacterium CG1_02_42_45]PIP21553.1 MAG: hypothetical protein COX39_02430 [Candidatus Nealsonbacteria bacterium CG23_combo_of_CG06-09_8_20_14_all_40_13]PIR71079.1 MAG: hypothetical protein COU44_01575 [Candidatus Nealsonbacteria bacterium CG10_big_fil_rev_8_21_14_0_10_40_24]PIU43310.1 MAG: hypothetical protein COS97_01750 [Candidatus Nealsonbacteria bacterium CG07_land_8_20_14_0_80_40_10]